MEGIVAYDRSWWQYKVALYHKDWKEYMRQDMFVGNQELTERNMAFDLLPWGTDFVIYAYGINKNTKEILCRMV